MKPALFLLTLACPLQAGLLATFQTTQGNVVVALQYDKVPKTVANFITLAKGSRPWVNPITGAVTNAPFYNGIKIHRTANDSSYKFAQGGSPKGDGTDGPGYTFKDEFDPSLTFVPYVLSMANSGPNTNGSQFFLTGSLAQTSYNNNYAIFGIVTAPASRAVVDAMIAAGPNGTTINGITFARTDAAAIAFDELAQNLPVCSAAAGRLNVTRGVSANYLLASPQPAGSALLEFRSPDLQAWSKLNEIYQGTGITGSNTFTLDTASLPRAFYQISLVTYPDALAPAALTNRTLVMGLFTTQTVTFHFDATGSAGTATYSENPTAPTAITSVSYTPSAYNATWIITTTAYAPFRIQGGLNTQNASFILGTNKSYQWNGFTWNTLSTGSLGLTK